MLIVRANYLLTPGGAGETSIQAVSYHSSEGHEERGGNRLRQAGPPAGQCCPLQLPGHAGEVGQFPASRPSEVNFRLQTRSLVNHCVYAPTTMHFQSRLTEISVAAA